jgi:hypothetical protein
MDQSSMKRERVTLRVGPCTGIGSWCPRPAPKVVIRRSNRVISAAGAAEALLLAEPKSEGKSKKGSCSKAFDLTSLPRYEK